MVAQGVGGKQSEDWMSSSEKQISYSKGRISRVEVVSSGGLHDGPGNEMDAQSDRELGNVFQEVEDQYKE